MSLTTAKYGHGRTRESASAPAGTIEITAGACMAANACSIRAGLTAGQLPRKKAVTKGYRLISFREQSRHTVVIYSGLFVLFCSAHLKLESVQFSV